MKNLIEKIENIIEDLKIERQKCFEEIDYPLSQVDKLEGRILAYTDIVMCLTDYNIITAPKSIKLSELIDKIYKTEYSSECYVKAIKCGNGQYKDDYRIHIEYGDGYWGDYEFYIVDGKISSTFDMDLPRDEFKWLYTLWIAGTEIVDDLKENE